MRIKQNSVTVGDNLSINTTQHEENRMVQAFDGVKAQLLAAARIERSAILADTETEANTLRQQAQTEAEQLIADAISQQEAIRVQAEQAGYEAGYSQGQTDGAQHVMDSASALLSTLTEAEARLFYGIKHDLAQLVESVCHQVVQQQTCDNPDAWVGLVETAIAHCVASKQITVVIPEALVNHLQTVCGKAPHLRLLPDNQLKPGQAYLITDTQSIDISLLTQVQQLVAAIKPENWVNTETRPTFASNVVTNIEHVL